MFNLYQKIWDDMSEEEKKEYLELDELIQGLVEEALDK